MIDQALLFLRDELNAYIHMRTNATTMEVKLSKIVNDLGKYAFADDSIALTIFNLGGRTMFLKPNCPVLC